ncbi:MAG TPA: hypothetical protein VE915_02800 [Actinomycetota bacterium]|jgi:Fe-S cluster assembly iron-binding protein IscA|nr:hypothetical protein [Actinomycetota bacterium]
MLPTDSVSDQDHTEEHYGVRVVIDKVSAPLLSEATIDIKDSLECSGFAHAPPWRRQ